MIIWFASCAMKIIWHKHTYLLQVENDFTQEMKIVALSEAMGG